MSKNLFRSEIIQQQATSTVSGHGEYVEFLGEQCISLLPSNFYSNNTYISLIPSNLFKPNTAYILDLWINRSELVSDETGGITIIYTDGTQDETLDKVKDTSVDFEHHRLITESNKTIEKVINAYHNNKVMQVRYDTYLCEVEKANVLAEGQFNTTQIKENNDKASIYSDGSLYCNNFYEY